MNTMIIPTPPAGFPVLTIPLPNDCEGGGVVDYVITHKSPLRRGMDERFNVYMVLRASGNCLNANIPVATLPTLRAAIRRATV